MRIVCPACAAVYQVPESLLGAEPRPLRCARCGHEWLPREFSTRPELDDVAEPTLAETLAAGGNSEPEPVFEPVSGSSRVPLAPPPPDDARLTLFPPLLGGDAPASGRAIARIGWAASVLLLVLLLAAAYFGRAEVQAAWPPSQRAYAAFGLR